MKCTDFLYKLFFKKKETPIVKKSNTNLNSCLIVHNLEPTYDTKPFYSTC